MWVIYRKKDQKVMGMSAHSAQDLEKHIALEEVVKGLVNTGPLSDFDAIQVRDPVQAIAIMIARLENLYLENDPDGNQQISILQPKLSVLQLTSDSKKFHPVDRIREITADGKTFTIITIQKVDENRQPLSGKTDNELLYLRTNYGTLQNDDGSKEISSIKLKNGTAKFRLVSETAKRVATIEVFNADDNIRDDSIRIAFV